MTAAKIGVTIGPMPISIAIVEDDAEIRSNLADIISRSDCRLLDAFPNAEVALMELPALQPQVVLMDLRVAAQVAHQP